MLGISSREAVIQNLKDAGCSEKTIGDFMICFDQKEKEKQLQLLAVQRDVLLNQIHRGERKISCLDYLICQIQQD